MFFFSWGMKWPTSNSQLVGDFLFGQTFRMSESLFFLPRCPISKDNSNEPPNTASPRSSFLSIPGVTPNRQSPSKSEGSTPGSSPPRSTNSTVSNRSFRFRSPGRSLGFLKIFWMGKTRRVNMLNDLKAKETLGEGNEISLHNKCFFCRVKGFLQMFEPWTGTGHKRTIQACLPTSWRSQEWLSS